MVTRDQILAAVFARLQAAVFPSPIGPRSSTTWVSSSRRLALWGNVDPSRQPYMALADHDEEVMQKHIATPQKLVMTPTVVCYARTDGGLIGSTIVNNMLDAVSSSLASKDPTSLRSTISGLVYNCWIEGRVFKDPGDLDDQAMLMVPLRITVP